MSVGKLKADFALACSSQASDEITSLPLVVASGKRYSNTLCDILSPCEAIIHGTREEPECLVT